MNVQVAESFWSNFWCSNITKFISPAIAAVKKTTTGMSFKLSIGPSHPISEIVTSHVYWLKKTRSRNMGDLKLHVFLIKRVQCHIFWVSSGCSEVGDHEIYQEQVQVMLFYSTILLLYSVSIYTGPLCQANLAVGNMCSGRKNQAFVKASVTLRFSSLRRWTMVLWFFKIVISKL